MMEKPELSKKSKYWIPRHRYYELKHFCLQYPEWEKLWREIPLISGNEIAKIPGGKNPGKPVTRSDSSLSDARDEGHDDVQAHHIGSLSARTEAGHDARGACAVGSEKA